MRARHCLGPICAALATLTLCCGDDAGASEARRESTPDAGGSAGASGEPASGDGEDGATGELDDDQIVGVMLAANAGEQIQGRMAMDEASDPSVRALGTRMYNEHGAANARLAELIETTSLAWGVSALAGSVADAAQRATDRLSELRADAFDREYVATQWTAQARLLAIVDDALLPAVNDPLLESELVTMRTAAADHLVEAGALREDDENPHTLHP
jgi:putative membrane protein